nr:MAG TPA: hypothetical protein [Caudoviricetes sp.]
MRTLGKVAYEPYYLKINYFFILLYLIFKLS